MKFLTDENIKLRVGKWLKENGHNVRLTPKGLPDKTVIELATQEGRVLITHDSDFSDSKKFPPSKYAGIFWVSLKFPAFERIIHALEHVLAQLPLEEIPGKLINVSDVNQFEVLPSE